MTTELRARLDDLRRFAKADPRFKNQIALVLIAARMAEKYPRSAPVQENLKRQLDALEKQMRQMRN